MFIGLFADRGNHDQAGESWPAQGAPITSLIFPASTIFYMLLYNP